MTTSTDVKIPEDEWTTVQQESGTQVIFENPGDEFIGVYIGYDDIPFTNNKGEDQEFRQLHFIGIIGEQKDELFDMNASYQLRRAADKLTAGQVTRITFVKETDVGQAAPMREFRVEVRK